MHKGRSVIYVARQLGHELEDTPRVVAEARIVEARRKSGDLQAGWRVSIWVVTKEGGCPLPDLDGYDLVRGRVVVDQAQRTSSLMTASDGPVDLQAMSVSLS